VHTALIFKEEAKAKELFREKGLAQPNYSIQHIEEFDLLYYKDEVQDLHYSIIETIDKDYCPSTINIFTSSGTDKNRK
jgi:hypothetical protein